MTHILIGSAAKHLLHVALLLPVAVCGIGPAAAASLSSAGALLCTVTEGQNETLPGKSLSCNFNGVAGGDRGYKGRIVLKGSATLPPGKQVIMWAVHAPDVDLDTNALVGRYREKEPGRLVGGKDGKIVLTPATSNARTRDAAVTVLELRLDRVEA
jgi:hypothetical protein